jgi:putative membrane protein
MKTFIAVALSSLALTLASAATVRADEKQKADADTDFLTKVIPGTAASVKIIEFAEKNAADEKVRDFAERVAKQHKDFVKTASENAKRLKIAVVTDPDKDSKETIAKLSKLKGTDLDVAFLEWLIDGHKDTTVFDSEVKNGEDAALKTFAKDAITTGHEHLHEAREHLARIKK